MAGAWAMPGMMLRSMRGHYHAPPYNQSKARKLARQTGIHPANPKRR